MNPNPKYREVFTEVLSSKILNIMLAKMLLENHLLRLVSKVSPAHQGTTTHSIARVL
jgi:hypothetical protein